MTGGLMQLVAYGAQDIYLTGNPMITYFKVVYRRHTNFAMESIQQTFNGAMSFGTYTSALISRNGDLISGIYLEINLPYITSTDDARWVQSLGHYIIDTVEVEIGGQLIDRQYGDWLEIWSQLTMSANHARGYDEMIGNTKVGSTLTTPVGAGEVLNNGNNYSDGFAQLIVPLQFWFCRNVGLALPLIALQYHEVKINLKVAPLTDLIISDGTPSIQSGNLDINLWVDYIYLDTDERRRFAQVSHEYLIEQVQINEEAYSGTIANVDLFFNHPVKELVWVARNDDMSTAKEWANYTSLRAGSDDDDHRRPNLAVDGVAIDNAGAPDLTQLQNNVAMNMVTSATLMLNGKQRFETRSGAYFNLYQTRCHTRIPLSPGINVYSFALKPEDHQPSGTCNFSRIDNARLRLTLTSLVGSVPAGVVGTSGIIKVFATNYNVLRIMSGMGGLAYSN